MSMKDNPGCGYVLAVAELIAALPQPHQAKATELLDDHDLETLQELLSQRLPLRPSPSCRSLRPRRRRWQRRPGTGDRLRPL